jgi:penicillin amidase
MMLKRIVVSFLVVGLALVAGVFLLVWLSLPKLDGEVALHGLNDWVDVASDGLGIPTIKAGNRDDAFRALGWAHARDRLFQMELMRRNSAGRLAELFGPAALEWDQRQRSFGFEQAARDIYAALPDGQKQVHIAYAAGVNAFLAQAKLLPPEFLALRHTPEPWRVEDNVLVALGMFQTLNSQEEGERRLTVMQQVLPPSVTEFLTPDTGVFDAVLTGGPQSRRPARPIPVEDWAKLMVGQSSLQPGLDVAGVSLEGKAALVDARSGIVGSNQWAVGGVKTRDGRALLANDMHLGLNVPNIWYRASLHYAGKVLTGVTLPGLPLLVVGSNGKVAWGFTNVDADDLDLVRLEINPANPDEYRTPHGWRAFERRQELIRVKGGEDKTVEVSNTVWGPVSPKLLMGQPVAVHWTTLQTAGVDMGLQDMDNAGNLTQAMAIMNRFGGPAQNVALADDQGHIGWTLMGRYPLRSGFDGSVSVAWKEGMGWDGYIPPAELPRLIDPPQGFIATANNRTLGKDYPHVIAHDQANGYRAYRIGQRLGAKDRLDEQDMLSVQLDTRSEIFDYYRDLALATLDQEALRDPELAEARRYIAAWDGRMEADSLGIGLLWPWREKLAAVVFAPVAARCRLAEADFTYSWRQMETPLRALLSQQLAATLPDAHYRDWRDLLLKTLAESARELKRRQGAATLDGMTWGEINRVRPRHPFSKTMPLLSPWLDMEETAQSGCAAFCVRVVGNGHGASERMAVSPKHPEHGILHMPGGQSGHPLSAHYRDQQAAWQAGVALPFLPGGTRHTLSFTPAH